MSENDAPIDPLLHAMEPVLEPDEATDEDERGQNEANADEPNLNERPPEAPDGPVNPEPIT